ncbi:hypothetical protein SAY86_000184 [Trapa natans]|uniref:Uncharacterized protein n=1 Tax=Trapa natans TaxID=22666 RepID=A0AAN7MX95_TRANT|nr:hypothetical protein SAY86_000184 [Trapa natans]
MSNLEKANLLACQVQSRHVVRTVSAGQGVIKAAKSAGLDLVPVSFGCAEEARLMLQGWSAFVKGIPEGDRNLLFKTVEYSNSYAVISPQMAKQSFSPMCGRSIYAQGTIDAVLFHAKKVKSRAEKHIDDHVLLTRGNLR